jgi:hypothetical protein
MEQTIGDFLLRRLEEAGLRHGYRMPSRPAAPWGFPSQTGVAQSRMVVRAPAQRPEEFAIGGLDR